MAIAGLGLTGYGIYIVQQEIKILSMIGNMDGPTSIFIAGKIGEMGSAEMIALGILLLIISGVLFLRGRNK